MAMHLGEFTIAYNSKTVPAFHNFLVDFVLNLAEPDRLWKNFAMHNFKARSMLLVARKQTVKCRIRSLYILLTTEYFIQWLE